MRRPFVHLAGDSVGSRWPKGSTPTPALLRRLDQFSSELINGDDGGQWAPVEPIVIGITPNLIGESGYRLTTGNGSLFRGSVETVRGNSQQQLVEGARAGIVLSGVPGDAPAPVFESPRSRVLIVDFLTWSEGPEVLDIYAAEPLFELDTNLLCPRAVTAPSGTKRSDRYASIPLSHRFNHRGSRLVSVEFFFQIGSRPTVLPSTMPRFRVLRVDSNLQVKTHTLGGSYDGNGWLVDPAASLSAYYNDGNVRSLTFEPDQFNSDTDPGLAAYVLQWMDDDAAIPEGEVGNAFLGARVVIDEIASLRSE